MENAPVGPNNKPKVDITIAQCGQMWSQTIKRRTVSLDKKLFFLLKVKKVISEKWGLLRWHKLQPHAYLVKYDFENLSKTNNNKFNSSKNVFLSTRWLWTLNEYATETLMTKLRILNLMYCIFFPFRPLTDQNVFGRRTFGRFRWVFWKLLCPRSLVYLYKYIHYKNWTGLLIHTVAAKIDHWQYS